MKKHHIKHAGFFLAMTALVFNTVFLATYKPVDTNAAAGIPPTTLLLSASSQVANNKSTITITGYIHETSCYNPNGSISNGDPTNGPYSYGDPVNTTAADCHPGDTFTDRPIANAALKVAVSGSGNTLSASTITTGADGRASTTLKSSVAETKTITLSYADSYIANVGISSKSVTFTAPPATKPSPTAPAPAATPAPSATNMIANVTLNDQKAAAATDQTDSTPSFKTDEPIVVSGTAPAGSTVRLYIFSEPRMVEVKAGSDGKWSYAIEDLASGDHHVEAAVLDSAGKETKRQVLGAFKIVAATETQAAVAAATQLPKKPLANHGVTIAVAIVVSLLALSYIAWYWWHHRKSILNHFQHR